MENMTEWINEELNKRGWTMRELARRAGLGSSTLSLILSGQRKPGTRFCKKIAKALGVSPEEVYRHAGLLPDMPDEDDKTFWEIVETIRDMTREQRKDLARYLIGVKAEAPPGIGKRKR